MDKQIELLRDIRLALQNQDYSKAIDSLEAIVNLANERGDSGAEGRHLGNLALTYYRLGQPEKALQSFERALECARRSQDRMTENGLLGNMGNILREMGQPQEAETYLNDALLIAQELGDTRGRGIWLSNLGLVYDDLNGTDEALRLHESSIRIARQLVDKPALATRLTNLANTYAGHEQYENALKCFEEAATIFEGLGRAHDLAPHLSRIGDMYAEIGHKLLPDETAYDHFHQAMSHYGSAMTLMREIGDPVGEAEVIRNIGHALADAGQYDDAAQYLKVAQDMFEALGLTQQADHSGQTLKRLIAFLEGKKGE